MGQPVNDEVIPLPKRPVRDRAEQLAAEIGRDILRGVYPPGTKLPGVRTLATNAGVNISTVQRALARLETDGMIESKPRIGNIVHDPKVNGGGRIWPLILEDAENRELALGLLDDALRTRRVLAINVIRDVLARPVEEYMPKLNQIADELEAAVAEDSSPLKVCEAEMRIYRDLLFFAGRPAVLGIFNDVHAMLRSSPPLLAACFSDPHANVMGWRAFLGFAPNIEDLDAALRTIENLLEVGDQRSLAAFAAALNLDESKT